METTSYKYFAFISYSSKDARWGKRLTRRLETYRMPATLCKEHHWQSKQPLKPVFFAPNDIQPGGLDDELKRRLEASRHLVVICSPRSARSKWVGQEIDYFHRLNRTENIHFFIVDGIPNSGDPETECFNPVVQSLGIPEILGANIHERVYRWPRLNAERAFVQLMTKLLGIEFDTLWRRHRRRLVKRAVSWACAVVMVVAAMVGVWLASRPVAVSVGLNEVSEAAPQLPPIDFAEVTLFLPDETKKDTVRDIRSAAAFANIPARLLGQPVRLLVSSPDCLPLDTTLTLSREMRVDLRRDAGKYGRGSFLLWNAAGERPLSDCDVLVDGREMKSDENGVVNFAIPLSRQKTRYPIEVPAYGHSDTLSMPCQEDISAIVVFPSTPQ